MKSETRTIREKCLERREDRSEPLEDKKKSRVECVGKEIQKVEGIYEGIRGT